MGAHPISHLFVQDGSVAPTAAALIRAACVAVVLWGVMNGAMGPLRASGDTRWPLYGQLLGLFVFALPAAYVGAVTPLGMIGLYLALLFETGVPAAVTYARFRSERWKLVSRNYRPAVSEA
jgi:Na+-driven multidrug efflux pump